MDPRATDKNEWVRTEATIAFVDLAGFSAISDVFGDDSAIRILELFEELVGDAIGTDGRLLKWIGDEAMLSFAGPDIALQALGRLLPACRQEPKIPLTRSGLNHGPVICRGEDVFGSTVNVPARIAAIASPGQLLATAPVATPAAETGILIEELGPVSLRSVAGSVPLFSIQLADAADPAWIDPVCKMHAPYSAYKKQQPEGHWFCSARCEEAFRKSPGTYTSGRS